VTDSSEPHTPDEHALEQARRMAALSWADKLDWLEGAQIVATRLAGRVAEGAQTPADEPRSEA